LGEGSSNLSEGDTATGCIGLQVPDAVEASEVRFAGLGGGEPFIWKVEQPRTPLCDDPCIGVDYSLACSRSMWSMSASRVNRIDVRQRLAEALVEQLGIAWRLTSVTEPAAAAPNCSWTAAPS
jgi:hypothetical protein